MERYALRRTSSLALIRATLSYLKAFNHRSA